jgi:transcriptional regulator with XRE-family HTH domain
MKQAKPLIKSILLLGISRKNICQKTGISPQLLSMIEHDKRKASLRVRRAFYNAYMISPWEWDKQ